MFVIKLCRISSNKSSASMFWVPPDHSDARRKVSTATIVSSCSMVSFDKDAANGNKSFSKNSKLDRISASNPCSPVRKSGGSAVVSPSSMISSLNVRNFATPSVNVRARTITESKSSKIGARTRIASIENATGLAPGGAATSSSNGISSVPGTRGVVATRLYPKMSCKSLTMSVTSLTRSCDSTRPSPNKLVNSSTRACASGTLPPWRATHASRFSIVCARALAPTAVIASTTA